MCYKHQFYGIESHRCVQMTPTLKCNQRCLFCWRSFEHEYHGEIELSPEEIISRIPFLQKKALSGYKVSYRTPPGKFDEAINPNQVAISLSGEPTFYTELPRLISLLNENGNTTFLVSNGTMPERLKKCAPYQKYVSLVAPDRETYLKVARPLEDYWDRVMESLSSLGIEHEEGRRTAIRITLVKGINDHNPAEYAKIIDMSGASFVEVKSYMHIGYSQKRLSEDHMPSFEEITGFTKKILPEINYHIKDSNSSSRVICLERNK